MPLKKGTSDKTREANIGEMIAAGHDPKQSVAAGYREQRDARNKARRAKGNERNKKKGRPER